MGCSRPLNPLMGHNFPKAAAAHITHSMSNDASKGMFTESFQPVQVCASLLLQFYVEGHDSQVSAIHPTSTPMNSRWPPKTCHRQPC